MSGSASAGSQKQNQTTTSNNSSNTNISGTNSGQTTIDPTQLWQQGANQLYGNFNPTGLNAGQQGQVDYLGNRQGQGQLGQDFNYANSVLSKYVGSNYTAPTAAAPGAVTGQTGAAGAAAYTNPWEQNVVDATMADLSHANDKSMNQLRATFGGQGWSPTAGATAGEQVAAGELAGDYGRNVASTLGNLHSQGFKTANEMSQSDANRFLTADQMNAQNTMANNQFNANQQSRADAQSIGVGQDYIQNLMKMNGIDTGTAGQIFDMAGGGNTNLLNFLNSQVPGFGTSTSGTTNQNVANTSSGTSTGHGSGSSKGGGVSVPLV